MPDPRILIAWLVLAILIVIVIIAPIAAFIAMRARRRAIARFEARRVEMGLRPKSPTLSG